MKVKVNIEELVVKEFEIEIPEDCKSYDFIAEEYYKGNIILDPGECQYRQMLIHFLEDDMRTEWREF